MITLHFVVRLTVDLPELALEHGALGTVLEVFTEPTLAYEVEFVDALGRTRAQQPLREDQIESVQP